MPLILASVTLGPHRPRGVLVRRHRHLVVRLLRPRGLRLRRRNHARDASAATTSTAACSSTRSARCGTATRSGCSLQAAPPSPPSPTGTPRLFSGFYLPLFLILAALIFRGVAFEFRSKRALPAWRLAWDHAIFWGSLRARPLVGRRLREHPPRACRSARTSPISARSSTSSTPTRSSAASPRFCSSACTGRSSPPSRPPTSSRRVRQAGGQGARAGRHAPPCVAFLAWTYVNAHNIHDTGLVPPVVPILAIAAIAAVGWLLREKLEGWAFVATAVGLVCLVATIVLEPVPPGHGLEHLARLRPDDRQLRLGALHAEGHDHRGADLHSSGARLPGMVVLGLPGARRAPSVSPVPP